MVLALVVVVIRSKIKTKEQELYTSELAIKKEAMELYQLNQNKLRIEIEAYFKKAIQSGEVVGVGVSIVKGDSIVFSDGFGKRDINNKAKVDQETVFRLGSLSKGFTGVLAANLQSKGEIDWNDKVVKYLPDFQFGDVSNTPKVKLSHILSHTSGAPYHSFTNLVEAGLPMAAIAGRFNEVTPINEPGVQYSYQNAMFALSQEVMRKATGKEMHTLLKERFFKPLKMSTVSMNHKDFIDNENVALPHSKTENSWEKLELKGKYYNAISAGGINASSLDMAKWMRFLLGHNPELMSQAAIQKVFTPFIAINYNNKYYQRWNDHLKSSYGFGWRIHEFQDDQSKKEYTVWHHGGSVNNYRNEIALYPDSDLGICVLLNGNFKIARTVIPDLHQIVKTVFSEVKIPEENRIVDTKFEDLEE